MHSLFYVLGLVLKLSVLESGGLEPGCQACIIFTQKGVVMFLSHWGGALRRLMSLSALPMLWHKDEASFHFYTVTAGVITEVWRRSLGTFLPSVSKSLKNESKNTDI